MVGPDRRRAVRTLDALATKPTLRRSHAVLALTRFERRQLAALAGIQADRIEILPNGVPPARELTTADNAVPEFLFCSRMHPRKRPQLFAEAATRLSDEGVAATFKMFGADDGEGAAVRARLTGAPRTPLELGPARSHTDALLALTQCDVLVLPSVDEPYPMVVLEAMAFGKPVIISDSCGLADFVVQHHAGVVVRSDSMADLAGAIRRLAESRQDREQMGHNGREAVTAHRSIEVIIDRLDSIYRSVVTPTAPGLG
jgi:glycosyltransferase involved in cell wall biosynthesis